MKKFFVIGLFAMATTALMAQATKPTLMVVPSDTYCSKKGYTMTFDNQGKQVVVSDYERALREDEKLGLAIHKIQEMMNEREFPLKDLEQTLKNLASQSAEDAMLTSKDGSDLAETPVDKLKKTAKADILIYLNWVTQRMGPQMKITFDLAGMDAYTGKNVATAQGATPPMAATDELALLTQSVLNNIDQFTSQLQGHFEDMAAKGREVSVRIKVWDGWEDGLETEYDGDELSEIIEKWMTDNCVAGRNHLSDATESMMYFDEVRIPLFDEKGKATDTRKWVGGLRKFLKSNYDIEAKLMMSGLGQAQLVIGGK